MPQLMNKEVLLDGFLAKTFVVDLEIAMCSLCLLTSMKLILIPNKREHLHFNDMNSFEIGKKKKLFLKLSNAIIKSENKSINKQCPCAKQIISYTYGPQSPCVRLPIMNSKCWTCYRSKPGKCHMWSSPPTSLSSAKWKKHWFSNKRHRHGHILNKWGENQQ